MAINIDLMARAIVGWMSPKKVQRQVPLEELRSQGFRVIWVPDIGTLISLADRTPLDAIVLDLEQYEVEPYRLVQRIRRFTSTKDLPILFLSGGRDEKAEVANALQAGADDFLAKPAAPELLAARMDALISTRQQFARPAAWAKHILKTRDGRVILNIKTFQCHAQTGLEYDEKRLTRKEFRVLATLIRRNNQLVRWHDFCGKGWKPRKLREQSRTLVQHVMRLRQKLGTLGARIETISGLGYRWND